MNSLNDQLAGGQLSHACFVLVFVLCRLAVAVSRSVNSTPMTKKCCLKRRPPQPSWIEDIICWPDLADRAIFNNGR
jgi:hypothetical protein